jgi:hypothetical protein
MQGSAGSAGEIGFLLRWPQLPRSPVILTRQGNVKWCNKLECFSNQANRQVDRRQSKHTTHPSYLLRDKETRRERANAGCVSMQTRRTGRASLQFRESELAGNQAPPLPCQDYGEGADNPTSLRMARTCISPPDTPGGVRSWTPAGG